MTNPVVGDVKLQNLKANHNEGRARVVVDDPVVGDVKLQNLKANHNLHRPTPPRRPPVVGDVKLQNLKANLKLCDRVEGEEFFADLMED